MSIAMAVHIPVAAERSEELLAPAITTHSASGAGAVLLDGTLGLGGHTERFLEHFPELTVIGLDRDEHALALAGERLARFGSRAKLVHTRYDNVADALAEAGLAETDSIDAALYDLGVSSMQLDEADRGFAYAATAPLDMRMDRTEPLTAADVLNTYSKAELTRILATYGEERFAAKIAGAVVREREDAPFATSDQLVELLYRVIPAPARRTGGHPAKRTFQALRVEVNQELESLRNAVPAVLGALRVGGRAVFLSYQSLEDRIVKTALAAEAASRTPQDLPVELPGLGPRFRLLTRGAEKASAAEIERNPRAASVRIRGAERIDR